MSLLSKIGAMIGFAAASEASLPCGGTDVHYGQLTREQALKRRKAKKAQKNAKMARRRNRK